ncbi:MAG: CBS domain-containing protein [Desulfobacter sp.]|nr:MAG: CBS domain-containing protein [Desulfobacter sp.]
MIIKDWMSNPPITIDRDDTLMEADKLLRTRLISMVPVMKGDQIAGIVTDGDLKKAMPSEATTLDKFEMRSLMDSIKIQTIMSKRLVTIPWNHTVDEAAGLMLSNGISGLPVMGRDGHIVGVITKSDIFRCFVSFTGVAANGQIFAFKLRDRPRAIKKILDAITAAGGRLASVLTSYDDIEQGFKKLFVHAYDLDPEQFSRLAGVFHESGQLEYVADPPKDYRKLI